MRFVWDDAKRLSNLTKHGLDFVDAELVYDSPGKLTFVLERQGEVRYVDIAFVASAKAVLLLVYTTRGEAIRLISYRRANRKERVIYEAGLAKPD